MVDISANFWLAKCTGGMFLESPLKENDAVRPGPLVIGLGSGRCHALPAAPHTV
jgi:hypothetical protein